MTLLRGDLACLIDREAVRHAQGSLRTDDLYLRLRADFGHLLIDVVL